MKRRCYGSAFVIALSYFHKVRKDIHRRGDLNRATGVYGAVYILPFAVGQAKGSCACAVFDDRSYKNIIAQHEAVGDSFKSLVGEDIFQVSDDGFSGDGSMAGKINDLFRKLQVDPSCFPQSSACSSSRTRQGAAEYCIIGINAATWAYRAKSSGFRDGAPGRKSVNIPPPIISGQT